MRRWASPLRSVALRPKVHQYKQYLDFLVPYVARVEDLYRKRYVGVGDDPFGMNKADDMPPVDVELCCHVYCALDACQRAIRGERMYHNVIPIVNFLDDVVAHADISSPDSWQY